VTPPGPRPSDPIWPTLTPDQRQVLLHALGRLLAWRLASAPRREGTLGKLRLSPIAEVLRTKAKAEQPEQPEPAVAG
jgi:hypothetical protein